MIEVGDFVLKKFKINGYNIRRRFKVNGYNARETFYEVLVLDIIENNPYVGHIKLAGKDSMGFISQTTFRKYFHTDKYLLLEKTYKTCRRKI